MEVGKETKINREKFQYIFFCPPSEVLFPEIIHFFGYVDFLELVSLGHPEQFW